MLNNLISAIRLKTLPRHRRLQLVKTTPDQDALTRLMLDTEDQNVVQAGMENPNIISETILNVFRQSKNLETIKTLLSSPSCPSNVIALALKDSDDTIRLIALAHSRRHTVQTLGYQPHDGDIRPEAPKRKKKSFSAQKQRKYQNFLGKTIAYSDDPRKCRRAIYNKAISMETLAWAFQNTRKDRNRSMILEAKFCSPQILERAIEHPNPSIRTCATQHPNASFKVLSKAIQDNSAAIVQLAAAHPLADSNIPVVEHKSWRESQREQARKHRKRKQHKNSRPRKK